MFSKQEKKAVRNWASFGKLMVVGKVAAVCGIAAIFIGSHSDTSVSLVSLQTGYSPEVEQAYLEYLGKYGKQYADRNEITANFEIFAKSYEIVKKHNAKPDRLFDMELDQFSDLSSDQLKNIKPEFDELANNNSSPQKSLTDANGDSVDWRSIMGPV